MRFAPMIGVIAFVLDILVINGAFVAGYYWVFGALDGITNFPFINLIAYFNSIWILLSFVFHPYRLKRMIRVTRIVTRSWAQLLVHAAVIFSLLLFQRRQILNIDHLVATYAIAGLLLFLTKVSYLYAIRLYRRMGLGYMNVAVLGSGERVEELKRFFTDFPEYGYHFKGQYTNASDEGAIVDCIREDHVQVLFINRESIDSHQLAKWVEIGEESFFKVRLLPDLRGISGSRLTMEMYSDIPVIHFESFPLDNFVNRLLKRLFDILFSLIILLGVLSWLTPIIALLIRLDSSGSVFFRQERTGLNSRTFVCYKFRTMRSSVEADTRQATASDTRVTALGRFLRKTSIDELPQFWNVLIGDMSVVGPRPHMLAHTEEFSQRIQKYMTRHQIKPGITGLAQVRGYRGETHTQSQLSGRIRLDRFYVENWTFLFDLKILLDTIRLAWRQKEAV